MRVTGFIGGRIPGTVQDLCFILWWIPIERTEQYYGIGPRVCAPYAAIGIRLEEGKVP